MPFVWVNRQELPIATEISLSRNWAFIEHMCTLAATKPRYSLHMNTSVLPSFVYHAAILCIERSNIQNCHKHSIRTIVAADKRVAIAAFQHTIDMLGCLLQCDIHVAIKAG